MSKFFEKNEGPTDRIIRAVLGVGFAVLAYFLTDILQILALIISVIMFFTAITGFCSLYKILGINTCPIRKK